LPIQWYFKKDGQEHGPVNSEEVRRLARLGILQPTDLVRKSDMTRWAPASALKGLFPSARAEPSPTPIHTSALVEQLVSAMQPKLAPAPPVPEPAPDLPPRTSARGIWYLTAIAALVAIIGGTYRFVIEPKFFAAATPKAQDVAPRAVASAPAQAEPLDPQLQAISTDSIVDRGLALQRLRADSLAASARPQVHQVICETLDDREYAGIWPAALRALGEIGSTADFPLLKPLIESGPIQTQCAAMATALILDPARGLEYFEPRAGDDKYGSATTTCLADFGPRCESAALAMLQSRQRMCRYHALYLLKEFGTAKSIETITAAKRSESDKSIVQSYQFTIDAINARNQ
jgi:hypothetical protein